MFRVNFDILGGMTLDEWLAEEDTSGTRHAHTKKKERETYEMLRNGKNTVGQTKWAMNCFTNWCEEKPDCASGLTTPLKQPLLTTKHCLSHRIASVKGGLIISQ